MKIIMAQLNPVVGDIENNVSRALEVIRNVRKDEPDLLVFPELFITGYPPKDLLERSDFISEASGALDIIAQVSSDYPGCGILIGAPLPSRLKEGKGLFNAAVLFHQGKVVFKQAKSLLPTYDVFDEARYFDLAKDVDIFQFKGEKLGITICEDAWNDPKFWPTRPYPKDPVEMLAKKGATLMLNISASPFTVGKEKIRFELINRQARKHGIPFIMVNQVGGNDDLIFDGRSFYIDASGAVRQVLPSFEEALVEVDTAGPGKPIEYEYEDEAASVFKALVLGTRDYVRKCGFRKVILGLSGGIDSSVTCVIAARAIGPDGVLALAMPSPYSSGESIEDAKELACNLGIELKIVPITDTMQAYRDVLGEHFKEFEEDATEENIQARIRGNILMAFSNKLGFLPLSTGNKSELAVGYCTLYGDMSGGLAVISDVPKTFVYRLADYINADVEVIPKRILEKPPSAELKPGQTDQDYLPPYDVLDQILARYIDDQKSYQDITAEGFDQETVAWVIEMVRKNEYKRKQAPPGLKVTSKAFGSGRRMPIAANYKV